MLVKNADKQLNSSLDDFSFSPEAARIEWILKLASPFFNAPELSLLICSKHFLANGDCSSSIPGGGEICFEADSLTANSLDEPSSVFPDKAVPDGEVDPWDIDCRMGMK